MRLSDVLPPNIAAPSGFEAMDVVAITSASAQAGPGVIFAGLPGSKVDGATFAGDAVARGSKVVIVGRGKSPALSPDVAIIEVDQPRRVLAIVAARLAAKQPDCAVAVTGTSGKTSVADFTRQILTTLGRAAASVGTIGVIKPSGAVYGSLTTPDPVTLHATLADLADEGVTHLAFEASSHGLDQNRLDGVRLTAGAFTNLGRDHMDYHATVEDYFAAKMRLFTELLQPGQSAVINADGAWSDRVIAVAHRRGLRVTTVGQAGDDLKLTGVSRNRFQQKLTIDHAGKQFDITFPLVGAYQVENALVAAGLVIATGETAGDVLVALTTLRGVPGRLEIIGEANGGLAIVDYAHKPEALAAALDACRPFATGKLISVFGCGGDRDRGKRPIMGRISAEHADVTIVTDDNPRTEEAAAIRREVIAGAPGAIEIGDRGNAIRSAIAMMSIGDVVLVAGKGHETGQIVGSSVLPFSDADEISKALADRAQTAALWTWDDLVAASGGIADGLAMPTINGFSIDTRTISPGDVFVALKDQRDGHDFVSSAFKGGAAAAIVGKTYAKRDGDGALIRVNDTLVALQKIGVASRRRLASKAVVFAVTGSVGKTGTKEMLAACLRRLGKVHASEKSYNNHWGVPLTLARMPKDADFAVFEIGMNHAEEIRPLTKMVQPHVALITTVEAVHIENFSSVTDIADAKAEIFEGLVPDGVAIIKQTSPHRDRLAEAAKRNGARTVTFGCDAAAGVWAKDVALGADGSDVMAAIAPRDVGYNAARQDVVGRTLSFHIAMPGQHIVENALAVLAALDVATSSADVAIAALATLPPPPGRGARATFNIPSGVVLIIDESYNANPASMRAALATLASVPRDKFPRRIAVLGDMLELGTDAPVLHASLKDAVEAAGTDLVFACGPHMKGLYDAVSEPIKGGWAETAAGLEPLLTNAVREGDVVMLKASNGTKLGGVVAALKSTLERRAASG